MPSIASMDLFVVPTISFRLLYGFLILQHSRRELLWLGVTARPSAHWIARQLTNEARTHLSLHKDAPIPRAAQTVGRTLAMPVLGGLHHQYFRA
jgi:hypothetical protein